MKFKKKRKTVFTVNFSLKYKILVRKSHIYINKMIFLKILFENSNLKIIIYTVKDRNVEIRDENIFFF